jgi:hypothetical protein
MFNNIINIQNKIKYFYSFNLSLNYINIKIFNF